MPEDKIKKKKFMDVDIVHAGKQIVLPEGMDTKEGIKWLTKKMEQEEQMMSPNIPINAYPFDGLVAFSAAIREVFGYAAYKPIKGFFGDTPPQFISIPISPTETIECPIGEIHIPGIDGFLTVGAGEHNNAPCLVIGGEIKQKHFEKVKLLAEATKEMVKKHSIYQGKAISLGVRKEARKRNRDGRRQSAQETVHQTPPTFIDVSPLSADTLILPTIVEEQVKSLLWAPIEHSAECRKVGVPLKRGVLLEGPYGTGKSLTANLTVRKAVENGWTFISLADSDLLTTAVEMASWYQPAVIFAEDIDSILGTEERNSDVNAILNVVDGIDKTKEILVVLTTNHVERINRAMLRPGRLDAIIRFTPPDAEASERLLRLYAIQQDGSSLIDAKEDISAAANRIAGAPASMVRETVERSKLSAIQRTGNAEVLTGRDLEVAAAALSDHLGLMKGADPMAGLNPNLAVAGNSVAAGIISALKSNSKGGNGLDFSKVVGLLTGEPVAADADDED